MARTHKGGPPPPQPPNSIHAAPIASSAGAPPPTPRPTTGGKKMPLIPPPRPTGLPKEGRYAVGFGKGMGAYLGVGEQSGEKGEAAGGGGEVVGLKYKFKPASIPLSSSGTITPSPSDSSTDVLVHLEGSSASDVHGFSGKVEKDAGGGEMREVLLVWEEDEQRFHLLPISHSYRLDHAKSLSLKALPRTAVRTQPPLPLHQPQPILPSAVVPVTRSLSPVSSSSRSASPPTLPPPEARPISLPAPSRPTAPSPAPLQPRPQPQRAGKRPLPPPISLPPQDLSEPPRGRPRIAYGGKTIALPPPGSTANNSEEENSNSDSSDDDEDDDFAQQLKQELARAEAVAASGSGSGQGGAVGRGGGSVGGKRLPSAAAALAAVPVAKKPVPVSLNKMMGVVDDDDDDDDSDMDSSDDD